MVMTRSQTSKNTNLEPRNMKFLGDNDSDISVSECDSRGATNSIERANLDLDRDHERIRYDQGFSEMNHHIREFTPIVKALADRITSTKDNQARNTPVNR